MLTNNPAGTVEPLPEPIAQIKYKPLGPLTQAQANALTTAENIAMTAQSPEYAPPLAKRDISTEFTRELLKLVETAREQATAALVSTTLRRQAVAKESTAWDVLVAAIREIQKAAKQKYARTNRIALDDYLVGKPLDRNSANLMQASQTVIDRASEDTLPGITPLKIRSLRTMRQEWVDSSGAVTEAKAAATKHRNGLKATLKTIEHRKLVVQLAADAEWPHTNKADRTTRIAFGLSPSRPVRV